MIPPATSKATADGVLLVLPSALRSNCTDLMPELALIVNYIRMIRAACAQRAAANNARPTFISAAFDLLRRDSLGS